MYGTELSDSVCEQACRSAIELLTGALPSRMYYHSISHTVNEVLPQALHLATQLNVDPYIHALAKNRGLLP